MERLAYKPRDAAQAEGVSPPTLYKWMHMEGFPVARIGGRTLFPVRAFERWLEQKAGVKNDE